MESVDEIRKILENLPPSDGFNPMDTLRMPKAISVIYRLIMRNRGSLPLADLAAGTGWSETEARQVGDLLVEKGFISSETGPQGVVYRIEYSPRKRPA
jgi:hypothetical protein